MSEPKLIEVHLSDCVGCRLCEMVCSLIHEGECSTTRSRIKVFRDEEFGNNLISLCMQCVDSHCIESCPCGALSRDGKTGAVLFHDRLCNGCQACITACPLGAISFDKQKNVVLKCDLCGGDPECVKVCFREALRLKDIDPNSRETRLFITDTFKSLSQMRK